MTSAREFGSRLKKLRLDRGLTLTALGELAGYSNSYLSQIETGDKRNIPSPETLEKLWEPLGVNYSDLLEMAGYKDLAAGVKLRESAPVAIIPAQAPVDYINQPAHYRAGKIECIDAIEAAVTGLEGVEAVYTAQVLKYIWRWKHKNGIEDLQKAEWYLKRLIDQSKERTT